MAKVSSGRGVTMDKLHDWALTRIWCWMKDDDGYGKPPWWFVPLVKAVVWYEEKHWVV